MPMLVSVQVGRPHRYPRPAFAPPGHYWQTAFFKNPVAGPVALGRLNLAGDRQADQRVHGGPDQAVLAYSADHYPLWRVELELPEMGPGGFGENFTIGGQSEAEVCIGDVYQVGDAVVQVSQPRGPCYKISWRWNRPDLLARVEATRRHGWYLRVLEEGTVQAGLDLVLLARPNPTWTVLRAGNVTRNRKRGVAAAHELAGVAELAAEHRRLLRAVR
jgi:MOSC domain-containing protein YiiM